MIDLTTHRNMAETYIERSFVPRNRENAV